VELLAPGQSKFCPLSGPEGLEPIRGGSTDFPTTPWISTGVGLISQDPFSLDCVSRVPKSPSRAYV